MFKSRKVHEGDAWDGVVIDKTRGMTDGSNLYHYVEVRLQDGTTKKARIEKALWETLNTGDHLVKEPGSPAPAKAPQ
ncbi:DUF7489 domain-containing protein [Streptomyces melanogenes]|uniref:DUF7489 domain-containing protein n=1 Tax=Streptomyces melanogenes TaxID=67326 RepID=UPI00167D7181|nr:hypothetical protein [Streptomyces melanogenes]GGP55226.1 hypothetical protein GCM10010278_35100 [Streptomyces melanogenes]